MKTLCRCYRAALLSFLQGLKLTGLSITIAEHKSDDQHRFRAAQGERGSGGGGGGLGRKALTKWTKKWFCLPTMPSVSHGKEQTERKNKRKERMTRKQPRKKNDTLAQTTQQQHFQMKTFAQGGK